MGDSRCSRPACIREMCEQGREGHALPPRRSVIHRRHRRGLIFLWKLGHERLGSDEQRGDRGGVLEGGTHDLSRSEEHTSELQSLLRISYAVSCLYKKTQLPLIPHL